MVCEVLTEPAADALYFWALQVGFSGGGAAHTGLQWLPATAGVRRAVNWGGYRSGGGELDGSVSPLPSIDGNPNTRAFSWETGAPHRLVVSRGERGWLASVDGVTIRELWAPGPFLQDPVVWSEVFARCDDPQVVVRWSDLAAVTDDGRTLRPVSLSVNYQSHRDGGCDNTDVMVDDVGVCQVTNTERSVAQGTVLRR
ncbi:MAG: hypothetical protein QOG64_2527 [Acidimicrobiaceae bacterium]|nr:hypothetical protein [Acidimicrobiaceae bacterium]